MRKLLNMLKKFRDNDNQEVMSVVEKLPLCNVCERERPTYQRLRTRNGSHSVCVSCFRNHIEDCNYCDQKSICLNEHGICDTCLTSSNILGYSEKPSPIFHRIKKGFKFGDVSPVVTHRESALKSDRSGKRYFPLHFGVEIETDVHVNTPKDPELYGSTLASLVNLIGRGQTGRDRLLYCKEDSTCYMEVVSHPFSWNYYKEFGKEIFQTLVKALRENNLRGHNTQDSGMHIHIGRRGIKHSTLYKVMNFVYSPNNRAFMLMLSQRTSERLEEWASLDLTSLAWEKLGKICRSTSYAMEYMTRSSAINLHNSNTIEFRLFRGTLNIQSFMKNLEFVHSIIHWSKDVSFNESSSLDSYLAFLRANQLEYSNLCLFLKRRGFSNFFDTTYKRFQREFGEKLHQLKFNSDSMEVSICA